MKNKILRKSSIGMAIAACMLLGASIYPVQASSLMDRVEAMTEEETDQDYSEDTNAPRTRSNHLNFGNVGIKKISNNECYVEGRTQAYHDCDKLYLDLSLEQKSNGSYSTYKSWSYTGLNNSNLNKAFNVLVPKNHYYRVRGYHAAQDSGVKESTTTLTKGIWIGN
ncbi:MAG TPA: hypothetical protein IAA11_02435 [Candidatus Blautia intestinigallinarum]|nr:hypothetical protein [Candidatus Blautia intestinigallinarum]